jgi:aryl-alcohol dehydrogenase-like predicted oxidoreductase
VLLSASDSIQRHHTTSHLLDLGPDHNRPIAIEPERAGGEVPAILPTSMEIRSTSVRIMNSVPLGKSGLKVSRACLGTMTFGNAEWGADESESQRIVDAFIDAGHNFIDTADVYNAGASEEIVGRTIASKRSDVVLATKGYNIMGSGPNDRGSSRAHLTRALEASLRRLGTDYVDLYQLHNWDHDTPIEESMAVLDGFVRSGKVRYLGCSNFYGSQLVEAQWAADRQGGTPLVSLQPQYSLIWRDIEHDILPTATRHGMGIIVWSPLGGGMLTGKYAKGVELPADGRLSRGTDMEAEGMRMLTLTDRNFDIVAEVDRVADELGATATAVSLAWVMGRPGVTSVIIGPRTVDQLQQNLAGFELSLPLESAKRLSRVSRLPVAYPWYMQLQL